MDTGSLIVTKGPRCCCSVTQSCLILWAPTDRSTHQASLPLTVSQSLPSSSLLHQWRHPAISCSDVFFSFCPQSFPASRSFPMSWLFISGDWIFSISSSPSMSIQDWFCLRLTGLIPSWSKGISGVFSSTTVWRHQFSGALPFVGSSSHNHMWLLGRS